MLDSVLKHPCCGCGACSQVCPVGCITFTEDAEGFLFPFVDHSRCAKCRRCEKVCPSAVSLPEMMPQRGYAYRTRDENLLAQTSSGGAFTAAAKVVLSHGGVVFGARFDGANNVVHCGVEDEGGLASLRKSKYVQSIIGRSYCECRALLAQGRPVLFCGTPCQIKALRLFLGRSYDALTTIDFVCHGVPSPGVFRRYLSEIAKDRGVESEAISGIDFRWRVPGYAYGFRCEIAESEFIEDPERNAFLRGFLSDIFLRGSCYDCPAKRFTSGADYTVGDFWGIERIIPDFSHKSHAGISQVFVHNDKLGLFKNLDITDADVKEFRCDGWRKVPLWVRKSVPYTRRREMFFSSFIAGERVDAAVERFSRPTFWENVKNLPKRAMRWMERRLFRR